MDVAAVLVTLATGTESERKDSASALCDRYFAPLASAIAKKFSFDEDCAVVGAGQALIELIRLNRAEVERLNTDVQLWSWLVRRGLDRAKDRWREQRAALTDLPKTYFEDHESVELRLVERSEIGAPELTQPETPLSDVIASEQRQIIHERVLQFLASLEDPTERAILLHDMEVKYEVLSPSECEEVDEEFRARFEALPTSEAMKKRRQRLNKRLAKFLRNLQ